MSTHGYAPGPGYALVVAVPGFWVNADGTHRADDDPGVALSGEGVLSCAWLATHNWRPDPWPEIGTYVKLPISDDEVEAFKRGRDT